jgi:hypothetical protein
VGSKLAPLLEFTRLTAGSSTGQPLQVTGTTEPILEYFVQTLTGKAITVRATPSTTIEELKLLVQEQEGLLAAAAHTWMPAFSHLPHAPNAQPHRSPVHSGCL